MDPLFIALCSLLGFSLAVGVILFILEAILVVLSGHGRGWTWLARLLPVIALLLWFGLWAYGTHHNPGGGGFLFLLLVPVALCAIAGMGFGYKAGRFIKERNRTP